MVGCSGWSYRHWRETVYGPDLPVKQWFAHYASLFHSVELNNTFYRLPPASTFAGWRDKAPPGFIFAVKVSQFGTHRLKLRDPGRWLPQYLERALVLGPHLGPNLVQLPPHWKRDVARLDDFLQAAAEVPGATPELRWAVEFRDPSWLHDSTYEVLKEHGAALCCHDLIDDHPWLLTAGWGYTRFHGPPGGAKYSGEYGRQGLEQAAKVLGGWRDQGCDVYAYFNNDGGGAAVRDATCLTHLLASP